MNPVSKVTLWLEDLFETRVYSNRPLMEFLLLFLMVYAVLDAIILAWFFFAPFAVQSGNRLSFGLGMLAYNFGYLTSNCHQMPQRSLLIGGFELPFCARDTAIYVGCIVAALLPFSGVKMPKYARSLSFAIVLMVPMAVDGISQTIFEMRESSNLMRVITGLLFGFGMIYYFAVRIVDNTKWVNVGVEWVKTLEICFVALLILFVAGYGMGNKYMSMNQAIGASGLKPSFVTYLSYRAMQTTKYDPYLSTYDDAVLREVKKYGSRGYGVWVIYEGPMEYNGKYVFFSGGNGTFKLIPDFSST